MKCSHIGRSFFIVLFSSIMFICNGDAFALDGFIDKHRDVQVVTQPLVLQLTQQYLNESHLLFCQIDDSCFRHGFFEFTGCEIYSILDKSSYQVWIYHQEADESEPHFLGVCGGIGGEPGCLLSPSSISFYAVRWSGENQPYFVVHVFVADTYAGRVARYYYRTHFYNAAGDRVLDELRFEQYLGEGVAIRPTASEYVSGFGLCVADSATHSMLVFNADSGALVSEYTGQSLGLGDFRPIRIAKVSTSSTESYLGILELGQLHLLRLDSSTGSVSLVSSTPVEGAIDVAPRKSTGFFVLADGTAQIYSLSGQLIGVEDLSVYFPYASRFNSITYDSGWLLTTNEYDEDSGITLSATAEGVYDMHAIQQIFLIDYEPITINYTILDADDYQFRLVDHDDTYVLQYLTGLPCVAGIHQVEIDPRGLPNYANLRVEIWNDGAFCCSTDPFEVRRIPIFSNVQPSNGATYCSGDCIFVQADLDYPQMDAVDYIEVELYSMYYGETVQIVTKDEFPNNTITARLTMPSFQDPTHAYQFEILFRPHMQSGTIETIHGCNIIGIDCSEPDPRDQEPIIAERIDSILFDYPASAGGDLNIYDVRGRRVARVPFVLAEGRNRAILRKSQVPSGVYFAKATRDPSRTVCRVLIVK